MKRGAVHERVGKFERKYNAWSDPRVMVVPKLTGRTGSSVLYCREGHVLAAGTVVIEDQKHWVCRKHASPELRQLILLAVQQKTERQKQWELSSRWAEVDELRVGERKPPPPATGD